MRRLQPLEVHVDDGARFEFGRCLGRGGFGEVYQAKMKTQGGVQRTVAVKVLRAQTQDTESAIRRLRDEAHLLAALHHRAIVQVHDLVNLDGRVALVTEYLPGADLDRIVREDGRMPPRAALEVIGEVAGALHAAFTAPAPGTRTPMQLVHRDIKPANLRVTPTGGVKVLDFGIARSPEVDREAHTTTGIVVGTVGYFSPERLTEDLPQPSDDVYALGCVLYEVVTGLRLYRDMKRSDLFRLAFHPDNHAAFLQERLGRAPDGLRGWLPLQPILQGALAADPEDRFTAGELEEACFRLVKGLDGPTLREWCRARTWTEPTFVSGPYEGRAVAASSRVTTPLPSAPRASPTSPTHAAIPTSAPPPSVPPLSPRPTQPAASDTPGAPPRRAPRPRPPAPPPARRGGGILVVCALAAAVGGGLLWQSQHAGSSRSGPAPVVAPPTVTERAAAANEPGGPTETPTETVSPTEAEDAPAPPAADADPTEADASSADPPPAAAPGPQMPANPSATPPRPLPASLSASRLLTLRGGTILEVRDLASPSKPVEQLAAPQIPATDVCLRGDTYAVVMGGTVEVRHRTDDRVVDRMRPGGRVVDRVLCLEDGQIVAVSRAPRIGSGGGTGEVVWWDAQGRVLGRLLPPAGVVDARSMGDRVLVLDGEGGVRVWQGRGGATAELLPLRGRPTGVTPSLGGPAWAVSTRTACSMDSTCVVVDGTRGIVTSGVGWVAVAGPDRITVIDGIQGTIVRDIPARPTELLAQADGTLLVVEPEGLRVLDPITGVERTSRTW